MKPISSHASHYIHVSCTISPALPARKRELLAYLQQPAHPLLRDHISITSSDIDRVMDESGCGTSTLVHVWSLQASGAMYASINDLIDALRVSAASITERTRAERLMLITHMCGPKCKLLAPSIRLTWSDIDTLMRAAGGAVYALRYLLELQAMGRVCTTWQELHAAVVVSDMQYMCVTLCACCSRMFMETCADVSVYHIHPHIASLHRHARQEATSPHASPIRHMHAVYRHTCVCQSVTG